MDHDTTSEKPPISDGSTAVPLSPESHRPEVQNGARRHYWRKSVRVIALFVVLILGGYLGRDFLKRLGPPDRCWEIKELEGHLYKVNPCTGQFLLLGDLPPTAPSQ